VCVCVCVCVCVRACVCVRVCSTASYVWGVAYERPTSKGATINQKIRVLLIQTSTLRQIFECTTEEQFRQFEKKMIRESSNKGYDGYRRKRLGQLQNLAWLFFTNKYKERFYLGSPPPPHLVHHLSLPSLCPLSPFSV
jgi:hypothetical protein